ncbi:MAG TPA: hypothetical protein VFX89_03140 [Gammaproteobacteria bacterium]|nr:hypothetical protein [Gammaproteobacteria bacterium]
MNPKSGKAGKAVAPAKPNKAEDADVADPGKVEEAKTAQQQQKTGKYGEAQPKPHKPPDENDETTTKKSWIEIELVDEANEPVPGEVYEITLPDGSVAKGTLDGKGFARVEGIEPGTCQVTFPDLDKDAWEPK